jgi:hypothetical protein
MGFIRQQEENLAIRMLRWKYQKQNILEPDPRMLKAQAIRIVDDAHRIARERGSNIVSIIKNLVGDVKEKK